MLIRHEVWSVPLGERKQILIHKFKPKRWQWAEKLAAFLKDKGYRRVKIKDIMKEPEDGP